MREATYRLGAHGHLAATLTQPSEAARAAAPQAPGCLLMSAGVVHRVGPHRVNVKLARALARVGIPSVRVDLAAVGDSRPAPTDAPYDHQALVDLRAALDLLQHETGVTRALSAGICSGAVYSLRCARADERVAGVLMIDGYTYPTQRTRRRRYLLRMSHLTPGVIRRSIASRRNRLEDHASHEDDVDAYGLVEPPAEEFARQLSMLLARGVSIFQLFTGSLLQRYNYDGQFDEVFAGWPDLAAVRTDYRPDLDHTMTSLFAQRELTGLLLEFAASLPQPRDALVR